MKYASAPTGPWSSEIKLFVGNGYDYGNGTPVVELYKLHADLYNCIAFTEPALLATDDALYFCMLGAEGTSKNGRIILLKYIHATDKLEYCGSFIINSVDGPASGYDGFSAPSLFKKDDKYYLMVTPQKYDNDLGTEKYLGTFVFEIVDLDKALLKRANGVLCATLKMFGTPGSLNGAAGYISSSTGSGIIYDEFIVEEPFVFKIYRSLINP